MIFYPFVYNEFKKSRINGKFNNKKTNQRQIKMNEQKLDVIRMITK